MKAPLPGTSDECDRFAELQRGMADVWDRLLADPLAPRTVVVVPSLSLDPRELRTISGVCHYEERMLSRSSTGCTSAGPARPGSCST